MKTRITTLLFLLVAALAAQAARTTVEHIDTSLVPGPLDVSVISPEGYSPMAQFPTVYLLNGYDGDHTQWTHTQPMLAELADEYGMILVMPDGRDSWYWDSPVMPDLQMESFIIGQLVPYIDLHYPTAAESCMRAVTGLSMGGHGALWLAMRHPDVFGSAGSTSGGVDIRPFNGKWKISQLLGDPAANADSYAAHTVMSLVPDLKPGEINIIFDCGTDDFFAEVNENLHRALLERKIPHDYISRPGNHSHKYWANSILYHLLFFNQQFGKCN